MNEIDKSCSNCEHSKHDGIDKSCFTCNASYRNWEPVEVASTASEPTIKDSGERREFETGAVRDMQEDKGRCDLMPLSVVARVLKGEQAFADGVLFHIGQFQDTGKTENLFAAILAFCRHRNWSPAHAMLELSKHFEAGALKYGERNWEKGLPESCYIDSAVRHYLKWLDGQHDEPHDRAVLWNLMCLWWTHENITGDDT